MFTAMDLVEYQILLIQEQLHHQLTSVTAISS